MTNPFNFEVFIHNLFNSTTPIRECISNFPKGEKVYTNKILKLFNDAIKNKIASHIEYLTIVANLDGASDDYTDILCNLLKEHWHENHEDIATLLEDIKSPRSIDSLYETILTNYKYLEYDDNYALAVKCIRVLGKINTNKSKEKLKLLTKSDNVIIKKNAIRQLEFI